jgi:dTDP-4-dehydrorhamnose reductase
MRILVTGASGLLGINLCHEAAPHHAVTGVVNRNLIRTTRFPVVSCDLLEEGALERLLEQTQPEAIIHSAALALVDECEHHPDLAWELNARLPGRLAALTAGSGIHLLHISTDAVFGGQRGSYTEEDETRPLGVYARTKRAGETAVLEADPQAAVARVNLFGWSLTGKRSLSEFFFYNLKAGKPVQGFTDVFFCPLLVNDLALVLVQMLAAKLSGLYHAVGSQCTSKYEFGRELAQRFRLDESIIRPASLDDGGLTAPRSPRLTLENTKLTRALHSPILGFSTGLDRLYQLYQQGYPQQLFSLRSTGE